MQESVREAFPDRYPSWTAVGVSPLALAGLPVAIRAVAVAGSGDGRPDRSPVG